MRNFYLVIALLFCVWSLPAAAQGTSKMVQCEACVNATQMKNAAIAQGPGRHYVFSLANEIVMSVVVVYEQELNRYMAFAGSAGPDMEQAFALMLDANDLRPHIFVGQQTIKGDINALGGGAHNPVEISLNGEHDDAYGSFIYHASSCLYSMGCASDIDPALGKLAEAEKKLNSIGFSIQGTGGDISWENLPPKFKLWLCDSNNDCALLQYDDGEWKYVESRAGGGLGKRYPKYGENLNYNFGDSGEAAVFTRGLRGGGAIVGGTFAGGAILMCTSTPAAIKCEYRLVLD